MSATETSPTKPDPFNWAFPKRCDLMSATGGLSSARDMFHMKKANVRPKSRLESSNLRTEDIQGKQAYVTHPHSNYRFSNTCNWIFCA